MIEGKEEKEIRSYLLGLLEDKEQERVEKRMLGEEEFFELLLVAEDEIVDEYLEGSLSGTEREQFEKHFLITPERRQKLRFAATLKKHVEANSAPAPRPVVARASWWRQVFSMPAMRLAAAAAVILVLAPVGVWRLFFYETDLERGLAALNKAITSGERPVEARMSGIGHAPYPVTTRGERQANIDQDELQYAKLTLSNEVKEDPGPRSRHALGLAYLAEGDIAKAQGLLEEAYRDDPNNAKLNNDLGIVWLEKGKAEVGKDSAQSLINFTEAVKFFNDAFHLDNSLLEALFNRALAHEFSNQPRQSAQDWRLYLEKDPNSQWAKEAKDHLDKIDKNQNTAQSEMQLLKQFDVAYSAKDDNRAWVTLNLARNRKGSIVIEGLINSHLRPAENSSRQEATAAIEKLSYAGRVEYERTGDAFVPGLARFYERATAQQRKASIKARDLMQAAKKLTDQNEYDQAGERYSNAAVIFEREGNDCEAAFARYWVASSNLRPAPKKSLDILQPLVRLLEEKKYVWLLALSLNSLADAGLSVNEFSKALTHAERAHEIFQKVEDINAKLRNLQTSAAAHHVFGEYRRSLSYIAQALVLADRSPAEPQEVWTFYHLAALNLYLLDLPRSALAFQKEALELARWMEKPLHKSRSYAQLGLIYAKLKNSDEALSNGQLALAAGQSIESEKSRKNTEANSILNLAHIYRELGEPDRSLEFYDKAIELHADLGVQLYTFQAHQGKLLALLELNNDSAIEQQLNTAIPLIEQYRPKIHEESHRNGFFDLAQSMYDIGIDFYYTRRGDADRAYQYVEASHGRSWLDLISAKAEVISKAGRPDNRVPAVAPPLSLEEIRRSLPEKSQVLEYAVLDDKILAWVGSKNGFKSTERRIYASDLNYKVERFRELILNAGDESWQERYTLAQELYEILIEPIEGFLDRNAYLCIIPDKMLHRLPFSALIAPASGDYFIKSFKYVLSPSANVSIKCSELAKLKAGIKRERGLMVGNPTFDRELFPKLEPLPAAADEAEQIASLYEPGIPLTGDGARETVVRAAMSQANVLHFASHYVVDKQSWMESRLLLAKEAGPIKTGESDGELQAFEIYQMRLPRARVAVLSACDTGIEHTYRGEGPVSMARPFIMAGVPIVVASLWAVDSDSTAELMQSFHKHRKQGTLSTMEALRKAQLDMLESPDQRNHHPYRWASFAAFGGYTEF